MYFSFLINENLKEKRAKQISSFLSNNQTVLLKNYIFNKIKSPYLEYDYIVKNNDTIESILKKFSVKRKTVFVELKTGQKGYIEVNNISHNLSTKSTGKISNKVLGYGVESSVYAAINNFNADEALNFAINDSRNSEYTNASSQEKERSCYWCQYYRKSGRVLYFSRKTRKSIYRWSQNDS